MLKTKKLLVGNWLVPDEFLDHHFCLKCGADVGFTLHQSEEMFKKTCWNCKEVLDD